MFGSAADTLESHIEEICNYFTNRTTSGVTEGINTRIKLIIRQSYGFKNFDLMKEKLLACLSPHRRESRPLQASQRPPLTLKENCPAL